MRRAWVFLLCFFALFGSVTSQRQAFALAFKPCSFAKAFDSTPAKPSTPCAPANATNSPASEEEESHGSHEHAQPCGNAVLATGPELASLPGFSGKFPLSRIPRLVSVALSEPTPPPEL